MGSGADKWQVSGEGKANAKKKRMRKFHEADKDSQPAKPELGKRSYGAGKLEREIQREKDLKDTVKMGMAVVDC